MNKIPFVDILVSQGGAGGTVEGTWLYVDICIPGAMGLIPQ